jgi:hypothetical protein
MKSPTVAIILGVHHPRVHPQFILLGFTPRGFPAPGFRPRVRPTKVPMPTQPAPGASGGP